MRIAPFFLIFLVFFSLAPLFPYAQKVVVSKNHHILILPVIARSIETGWSFGIATSGTFSLRSPNDSITRTSNLQALALVTTQSQIVAALNGSIYLPGEKFILNQQFSYSYFPDQFWGIGKIAQDSSQEPYKYRQFYVYLHPQRLLARNFFLGMRYEFQKVFNIEYKPGGIFDQENVAGRTDYHVSGLGLSFTFDSRNNAFSPDRGAMYQFYFSHFDPFFASDYKYTNFVIDLRRFLRIVRGQILAFQAYGFFNTGDVPLRSLASLGGSNCMRGYYFGRYRDKNMGVLQAEYRIPLFWQLAAVVFGDCGNVGSRLGELNFQELKYSYGGGLRVALNKAAKLNLRLDYGIVPGSTNGFYLQLGEAF
jgi:outer membrane protein assembly factor BamA